MPDDMTDNTTASIEIHKDAKSHRSCIPKRYVLCFLGFLGFFNVYALRVNLSVALVAMLNHSAVEDNDSSTSNNSECPVDNTTVVDEVVDGPFAWSPELQGIILGSFFYGYIFTQIPGGWLAGRYGGKNVLLIGIFVTSVLTLLIPLAAGWGPVYLIALRILIGLAEGGSFPAMHAMWGRWAPPLEHSKLGTFTYSGMNFGTFVSLPVSGLLATYYGWPSVFYVFGILGCVWSVIWWWFVYDSPQQHPYITTAELNYIQQSISAAGRSDKYVPPPWKDIVRSAPFYSIIVAHTCNNWGYYTMLVCLPTYMSEVHKFNIGKAGFITAMPYLVFWVVCNSAGYTADTLRYKQIMKTKTVRKLWCFIAFVIPGALLVAVGQVECNHELAIVFITLAVGINGFHQSGFLVNHLDIAPRFAGILMGVTNTFATIPGMIGPYVVGVITAEKQTAGQWAIVFYISAAIFVFGAIFFAIFADGKEQAWNNYDTNNDRTRLLTKTGSDPANQRLIREIEIEHMD